MNQIHLTRKVSYLVFNFLNWNLGSKPKEKMQKCGIGEKTDVTFELNSKHLAVKLTIQIIVLSVDSD